MPFKSGGFGLSADTALNEEALNKLMALQTQVLKTDPSATALRVADILNYPGIVAAPVPDPEVFAKQVLTGFEQCLEVFNESRQREGAALAQVLLKYSRRLKISLIRFVRRFLKFFRHKRTNSRKDLRKP